ncbi:MAG: PHP domain-containing protein [Candidatus Woesearchaeota archaeon]|nr:PHP domain-containing protein [Candidatus Woesearchaeota archaeon]
MKNADLHTHSIYSDGIFTPKELAKKAKEKGIKYLALTDHNSVEGVREAVMYGKELGIEIIPGVEVLSDWGEVIGYFIDINNEGLLNILEHNKKEVNNGTRFCIQELRKLGVDISYEEVKKEFPKYPMMYFFVAQILVKKDLLKSTDELCGKYIGKLFTIKYNLLKTEEVISAIRHAGGVAVLSHPFVGANYKKEFKYMHNLVSAGLAGIEIENGYYKNYKKEIKNKILKLAKKYNLILTSGSDFHGGIVKSNLGDCMCDENVVKNMKVRKADEY